MEIIFLGIATILAGALLVNLWPMRKFAPWVPLLKGDIEFLFQNIFLKPGSSFVDLGCGDGRVVFAAAERFGVRAVGVELLYPLYWWCKIKNVFFQPPFPVIPGVTPASSADGRGPDKKRKTKRSFSVLFFLDSCLRRNDNRREGDFHEPVFVRKDLFTVDLSHFDTVFVYGLPEVIAGKVKEKFEQELKPGALVISPWFPIPGWKVERVLQSTGFQKTKFYVYRKV